MHREPAWVEAVLLGLTPAEARVNGACCAKAGTVRDITLVTRYRESYVRWLLKTVYRKQGLAGQVDLVRRVLTLTALP